MVTYTLELEIPFPFLECPPVAVIRDAGQEHLLAWTFPIANSINLQIFILRGFQCDGYLQIISFADILCYPIFRVDLANNQPNGLCFNMKY